MSKKIIVLDAGHGGKDSGATGVNGYKESNKVLSIVNKLKPILERCGFTVVLTRTGDEYLSLSQRVSIEKKYKAICCVSIHCNAYNKSVVGLEVFKSASSGSNKLANAVYNQMIADGLYNAKRGVKSGTHLQVVRDTNSPTILIETAFIDSAKDFELLKREDDFAVSIAKGICSNFGVSYVAPAPPAPPANSGDAGKMFRVVCGTYKDRANAVAQQEKLKKAGFDSFLVAI